MVVVVVVVVVIIAAGDAALASINGSCTTAAAALLVLNDSGVDDDDDHHHHRQHNEVYLSHPYTKVTFPLSLSNTHLVPFCFTHSICLYHSNIHSLSPLHSLTNTHHQHTQFLFLSHTHTHTHSESAFFVGSYLHCVFSLHCCYIQHQFWPRTRATNMGDQYRIKSEPFFMFYVRTSPGLVLAFRPSELGNYLMPVKYWRKTERFLGDFSLGLRPCWGSVLNVSSSPTYVLNSLLSSHTPSVMMPVPSYNYWTKSVGFLLRSEIWAMKKNLQECSDAGTDASHESSTHGMSPRPKRQTYRHQEHEDRAVRPAVKKVDFDVTAKEKAEEPTSYTCTVVGGVAQMIPMGKNTSESQVVRRRAKTSKRVAADRRISCKDLGRGDCEGWLYKKKQSAGPLGKNWKKRWCVLKESNMFHYKRNDDLKAEGVIHLPAFKVSPAPEMKSKKFEHGAFKVHNAGTTFYFASERQDDMSKWMNKMGLAAINYDMSNVSTTGGFIKPDKPVNTPHAVQTDVYYSESEDDNDDASSHQELSEHSEGKDYDSSNDDLKELYKQLERRNLTIVGTDRNQRRRSHIQSADMKMTVSDEQIDRMKRICILKRLLKDKEIELETLENILGSGTPHQLQEYKELYGSTQSLGRL
uniref:PH domain-containing protein n=1 Tax=Octopus bimaculoides TaxID=37653 RepID=A0A0L8I2N8_OCTBM